jgi:5'-3' exonuclease
MTKEWSDLAELETAQQNSANSLLILDGNNLSYRYLHRKNYDNFKDDYIRTVESLSKSYNAERTIVCFDFGKSYYRKELFPEYKENRVKPKEAAEIARYDEFFECLNSIPESLPCEYYKFRGVEADDLIAYLIKNVSTQFEKTWVVTSDRDMYQLLSDTVSIFNIFARREIDLAFFYEQYNLTPEEYLLSRILEGDKGDNIEGVAGIGPKRSQALSKKYKNLDNILYALPLEGSTKYIHALNDSKELIIRNEKLMDLKRYNKQAITAGKEGKDAWELLSECVSK